MQVPHHFSLSGKILILRYSHLGRIPPALYGAQLLAESGLPVVVVEYGEYANNESYIDAPLCKLRIPSVRHRFFPKKLQSLVSFAESFWNVTKLIRKHGVPHLLIAHGLQEQALALILSWIYPLRYGVHVHEPYESWELSAFNKLLFSLEGAALRKAAFTIFPEKNRQNLYFHRYGLAGPSFISFNCPRQIQNFTPYNLRRLLSLPDDSFLIGYFGGVGALNAPDLLIQAIRHFPQVHFLVWGWVAPEYLNELRTIAKQNGTENRVHFLGELKEDKWNWIAGLNLSYCVYRQENLRSKYQATASNKLFESLSLGLPVLVGEGEDFQAFLEQYPVGFRLAENSVEALASTLKEILSASPLLQKRELGLKLHRSSFNYETQFSPVLSFIKGEFKNKFEYLTPIIKAHP